MSRRIHDLTLATLDDLPAPCRACLFWESGTAARGPERDEATGRARKEAWWQATQLEWGAPGKGLYVGEELVGYAAFAPAGHYARVRVLRKAVSDDALLLATVWVHPGHRGAGLGKVLLQSVLREAHRRGWKALEAYGRRHDGVPGRSGEDCVVTEAFLLANGFQLHHDDPQFPLFRLDLRQTARWAESWGQALEGVISALARRERAPAPARSVRHAHPPGPPPSRQTTRARSSGCV